MILAQSAAPVKSVGFFVGLSLRHANQRSRLFARSHSQPAAAGDQSAKLDTCLAATYYKAKQIAQSEREREAKNGLPSVGDYEPLPIDGARRRFVPRRYRERR